MDLNIAACVILFNPKEDDLQNLSTYINKVKKVYIFDNTEGKSNEELFYGLKNVDYFWENENKGLSIRLNQACKIALSESFDYLLTMDQDSSFLEVNIDQYYKSISDFKGITKVATFGLEFDTNYITCKKENVKYVEKDYIITSSTIMNLNLFEKIGGFDENLFIDGVDIDYCYNALTKGFKNIEFQNNYFKHSLGEHVYRASIFSVFLLKKRRMIHSNIRVYYMQRNLLYLEKKYKFLLPNLVIELRNSYEDHIKRCLKYSDNIFKTYRYKIKAIKDFKNNKMGKFTF